MDRTVECLFNLQVSFERLRLFHIIKLDLNEINIILFHYDILCLKKTPLALDSMSIGTWFHVGRSLRQKKEKNSLQYNCVEKYRAIDIRVVIIRNYHEEKNNHHRCEWAHIEWINDAADDGHDFFYKSNTKFVSFCKIICIISSILSFVNRFIIFRWIITSKRNESDRRWWNCGIAKISWRHTIVGFKHSRILYKLGIKQFGHWPIIKSIRYTSQLGWFIWWRG